MNLEKNINIQINQTNPITSICGEFKKENLITILKYLSQMK
jgi:hypothetical protein